jgi:2-methylisocitrate lyase-like PEP mutase family enzyme
MIFTMTVTNQLRAALEEGSVQVPFVVDGLQAIMAREAGFRAGYLTGFGAASTLGLPDVGLLTMTQMCEKIRVIAATGKIPIIADADTGYGNYINAYQTVREYERAGAAALHIEDQLWPKRCGYMQEKQVIEKAEAVSKIKAAVDARQNESFVIIARTDALAVNGWNDVVDRIGAYMQAGADMAFVDGIKDLEDIRNYAEKLSAYPLLFNNVPMIPLKKLTSLAPGFKLILSPYAMSSAWTAYEQALGRLKADDLPDVSEMDQQAFARIITILGAPKYFEMDRRYGANKEEK